MSNPMIPRLDGTIRKTSLHVPEAISRCSGIEVFGRLIKSFVFSTDISIIRNTNADAVLAVYPFTPQTIITQSLLLGSDIPVFAGVGGGLTQGTRVIQMSVQAEMQGAAGVVVNAPTANTVIEEMRKLIQIPVIVTIISEHDDFDSRVEAGASAFNVSGAAKTPELVKRIRDKYPEFPIIATGGATEESVAKTVSAGANAITWTPPTNGELFKEVMDAYRSGKPHP